MSYISIKNVAVGYKSSKPYVLDNVNIEEDKGSFIALLGENGAGKSTLLKTLAGLLKPITGEIFIKEKPISSFSISEKSKILSVVLTERNFSGMITVEELVAMGRYPYQSWNIKLTQEDKTMINEAIEKCELTPIRNSLIHELSDGQKQKALIARAIAQDTELLLLDEPTNHLDIKNKYNITKLLRSFALQGKTVLITTHDIDLATKFCDKLWLITQNRNLEYGNPQELLNSGKLDTIFSLPLKELMGR